MIQGRSPHEKSSKVGFTRHVICVDLCKMHLLSVIREGYFDEID